jgi:hypothetical protein
MPAIQSPLCVPSELAELHARQFEAAAATGGPQRAERLGKLSF